MVGNHRIRRSLSYCRLIDGFMGCLLILFRKIRILVRIKVTNILGVLMILRHKLGRLGRTVGGTVEASGQVITPIGPIIQVRGGRWSRWDSSRVTDW